jgi:23S rRNA (guanosine2251-2'-O)-methyltransferase
VYKRQAIARSAYCAGVHALVISSQGSAPLNEDAIKTSAGALHHIQVCKTTNIKTTLNYLRECGIHIIACTEKATETIYDTDMSVPCAIIMGSEDKGISPGTMALIDTRAAIPIEGNVGSLNVSVAAGIILFEALRQRK